MNDRLAESAEAALVNPAITPQMQEILYRALEREPKNRYSSAREMARDLEHQDEVGVAMSGRRRRQLGESVSRPESAAVDDVWALALDSAGDLRGQPFCG